MDQIHSMIIKPDQTKLSQTLEQKYLIVLLSH